MCISGFGVLALAGGAVAGAAGAAHVAVGSDIALSSLCALTGLWWWFTPSENRMRAAADRYAERILDTSAALA